MEDNTFFLFGLEVNFDRLKIIESARAFVVAAQMNNNPISYCVVGYDDDPRELWDIPEVMLYLRQWYQTVKQLGGNGLDRLDQQSQGILLVAIGEAIIEDTPTGKIFKGFGKL